jgi:hypothetical protein
MIGFCSIFSKEFPNPQNVVQMKNAALQVAVM